MPNIFGCEYFYPHKFITPHWPSQGVRFAAHRRTRQTLFLRVTVLLCICIPTKRTHTTSITWIFHVSAEVCITHRLLNNRLLRTIPTKASHKSVYAVHIFKTHGYKTITPFNWRKQNRRNGRRPNTMCIYIYMVIWIASSRNKHKTANGLHVYRAFCGVYCEHQVLSARVAVAECSQPN